MTRSRYGDHYFDLEDPRQRVTVAPMSLDLEHGVLGACLHSADATRMLAAGATEACFSTEKNRAAFRAFREAANLNGHPLDIALLGARLADPTHAAVLFEAGDLVIPANVPEHLRELRKVTAARFRHAAGLRIRNAPTPGDEATWSWAREQLAMADALMAESSASTTSPRLLGMGGGAFLAQQFPPTVAYVEDVLSSDGGGWIGGEEKLGKSYYALEEALCLAFALTVCGRFAVPDRRRVLFLEEEDSPRRAQARLQALIRGHGFDPEDAETRAELEAWLRIVAWEGFSFDNPEMVASLDATIAAFRPAVVYVDVLRKVTARDLNKAVEASALLAILDDLRRRHNVVFRLIHHYRKNQGFRAGRGSQEIGGSFVLGAWAEQSLFFEPISRKQGDVRVSVQTKDGAPVPAFRLLIESEGPSHAPTLVRLIAKTDEEAASDADDVIAQAVGTLPKSVAVEGQSGVSITTLVQTLKKSDKTIRRALERLVEAGRVLVTGTTTKQAKLYGVVGR